MSARLRLLFVSSLVAAFGVLTAAYAATGRFPLDQTGAPRALAATATGPLVANDREGSAILTASRLVPGAARSGEVTIANAGDAPGAFSLSARDLADSPVPAGPLSGVLDLVVQDVTPGRTPATVFAGKLNRLGSVALGSLRPSESRRYRFVVTFPAGRAPALDDPYQGASTSVTFAWDAVAVPTPPPVTQPPVTQPPVTTPPLTQPPVTQPPASIPPAAQPPVTAPPASQPPATTPPATTPAATTAPATTPAPVPAPPAAARLRITVPKRQRTKGSLVVTLRSTPAALWRITGVVAVGRRKAALRPVRVNVRARARNVRLRLPTRARALAATGVRTRRRVIVRLVASATVPGRRVTVRKTVRLSARAAATAARR